MRSRNKIILAILTAWVLLISIILLASESIFVSGFEKLERDLATDSANRVYHVSLALLNYIYLQNMDSSYWDEAYNYMKGNNPDFIQKNFSSDFFVDNKINYLIVMNKDGKIVWSEGFDLKTRATQPVDQNILSFFQENGVSLLIDNDKYYHIAPVKYGASGLLQLPDNAIGYFTENWIKDSADTEAPEGVMIFGKKLTSEYFNKLSEDLSYPINLILISDLDKNHINKKIVSALEGGAPVYSEPVSNDAFMSYKLLRDFNQKPIAMLQIEQSRKIYNESRRSAHDSQLIFLALSLLGALAMSGLVYWFFRKQELITRSFERFVPHELIDLLLKRDILDVKLGDNSKRVLSVLFLDIRNFTTISEGLTSQANFNFINALLKKIAPVIAYNNGFIDKYIGDAVMALFPLQESSADDAVKAAKMILEALDKLNAEGELKISTTVKIGIGINTGEAMLGIIGAEHRIEGTVISDMVNTASRIQTLTKTYGHGILISEASYKAMKNPEIYIIKHVDNVLVKGKTKEISIYSVE
jgi:class 3 adenylate cyclase/sensor domain CHASE-containing protein